MFGVAKWQSNDPNRDAKVTVMAINLDGINAKEKNFCDCHVCFFVWCVYSEFATSQLLLNEIERNENRGSKNNETS